MLLGRPALARERQGVGGPLALGHGDELDLPQGEWATWARSRERRESDEKFLSFFLKHIFKSKFKSNSNVVSNILFMMRTFARFPKLNFCKLLKILLFSNSLFIFFYFKAIFNFIFESILNFGFHHSL